MTSYTLNEKLSTKKVHPGITIISCAIGKTNIHNSLCDLGARVSVMPFSLTRVILDNVHGYLRNVLGKEVH
jgi:hypothetical protein